MRQDGIIDVRLSVVATYYVGLRRGMIQVFGMTDSISNWWRFDQSTGKLRIPYVQTMGYLGFCARGLTMMASCFYRMLVFMNLLVMCGFLRDNFPSSAILCDINMRS